MNAEPSCPGSPAAAHCITCSDEGLELRVLALHAGGARCVGADGSVDTDVIVDLVEPVLPGDLLLVHAGVALRKLGDAA